MDRTVKILDLLAANKSSIKISSLSKMLDVSRVTLSKDLDILEKRGIIQRKHGYACLDDADDASKRLAYNHSIKRRIAKAATQIVEDGETIMLESGSCCALFAEELALARKNVTIITNSIFIANYICRLQNIKIILLGGYFQPDSQVLVGAITTNSCKSFFIDKFFIGTDGFVSRQGFTGRDHLRAETALKLANRAKNIYVLTEAAKFKRHGAYNLVTLEKTTGVFTDDGIPKEAEADLQKNNVKVYKVPSVEETVKWEQFPGQPPILYKEKK